MKKEEIGFKGEISDVSILPEGDASLPHGPDLVKMAEKALSYLVNNPVPSRGYQSRFSFTLLNCPSFVPLITPTKDLIDPVAIGDTDIRNDIAFNLMREMTGLQDGSEAQDAVHRQLVGLLRSGDGSIGGSTTGTFTQA